MGFGLLFDEIEPTGFGLNSLALPRRDGNERKKNREAYANKKQRDYCPALTQRT